MEGNRSVGIDSAPTTTFKVTGRLLSAAILHHQSTNGAHCSHCQQFQASFSPNIHRAYT